MNIDKFGHHVHKRLRVTEYIDSLHNALKKSNSGDYDLNLTRLRGLPQPISEDEAVNKNYIDSSLRKYFLRADFEEELKREVAFQLKQFKDQLYKALSGSYYTKPEINNLISKIKQTPENKHE